MVTEAIKKVLKDDYNYDSTVSTQHTLGCFNSRLHC
jgi:hypothetical protein